MRWYRRLRGLARTGGDVRLTSFDPRAARLVERGLVQRLADPVTAGRLVDDDVFDPRLQSGRDHVEGQRQAADHRPVERREEQHAVGVADDRLESGSARRRRRGRQLRDQAVERRHEVVVDGVGNRDLGSHSDWTLSIVQASTS